MALVVALNHFALLHGVASVLLVHSQLLWAMFLDSFRLAIEQNSMVPVVLFDGK